MRAGAASFVLAAVVLVVFAGCSSSKHQDRAAGSAPTTPSSPVGGATSSPKTALSGKRGRTVAGRHVRLAYSAKPPEVSMAKIEPLERATEKKELRNTHRYKPVAQRPVRPRPGTQSSGPLRSSRKSSSSDFTVFRSTSASPSNSIATMDPSGIVGGSSAFMGGNFFTAKSGDAGRNWSFANPFEMADFCCDQDFAYDKSRNMVVWVRQSWYDKNSSYSKLNRLKIAASTNGGSSWCYWDFTPTSMSSSWTSHMLDRPTVALTTKNLIVTSNMYAQSGATDSAAGAVIWRISLDSLKGCGQMRPGTDWNYWKPPSDWGVIPAQGGGDTAYFASRQNNSTIRVYRLADSTTWMYYWDRIVPTFTSTNVGSASCALPNGKDPCKRTDDRVQTGWKSRSRVTFMWNVGQGSGFAKPYIDAASFDAGTMAYLSSPYLSDSTYASLYPAANVNARGDVAVSFWRMNSSTYPAMKVAIDDDLNGAPPPWDVRSLDTSSGWGDNTIGDYTRVEPVGNLWAVFGATGSGASTYTPRLSIVGRERDRSNLP